MKSMLEAIPPIGAAFVTIYNDGSGAQILRRIGEDKFREAEGCEDATSLEALYESSTMYFLLPDGFKMWCEHKRK